MKDGEDDCSSDGEWIDISHSSEDDAEEEVDIQNKMCGRNKADQKHDEGIIIDNEEENGDRVISLK